MILSKKLIVSITGLALLTNMHGAMRDFDGDGKNDFLWRRDSDARTVIHFMDDVTRLNSSYTSRSISATWNIVGYGDFDGDGKADILWRNSTNSRTVIHFMDGATFINAEDTNYTVGQLWCVEGVEDFNGDDKADILWRNSTNGEMRIHYMNGSTFQSAERTSQTVGLNWEISGVSDFDGDGNTDIVWRKTGSTRVAIQFMNGSTMIGAGDTNHPVGPNWELEGAQDMDGDGKGDLLWRKLSNGSLVVQHMDGLNSLNLAFTDNVVTYNWELSINGESCNDKEEEIRLGRGVNFGNMLEAPNEGDWGLVVEERFFDLVKIAGFDHIRLPISWTYHADVSAPYLIDETFFQRVDWAVNLATSKGLKIVVNNHHYDEMNNDPVDETPRALALWQQISERYQNYPVNQVFFEIHNEPHGAFNDDPELWNQYMTDALAVIRVTNPERRVLVGPVFWNSIGSLSSFSPPNDPYLIATFHYYDPFPFTHQGAAWITPVPPLGAVWNGEQYSISSSMQNWSWGTTGEATTNGLEITYDNGWSAFQLHNPEGFSGMTEVKITLDKAMSLQILVSNVATDASAQYPLTTTDGEQEYTIDVSHFGANNLINNVAIQNNTPNPQTVYTLTKFAVTHNDGEKALIETEGDVVESTIAEAKSWGEVNNMSVHIGEFGAYEPGDINSRVLWTTKVREVAEDLDFDWSYWEFGAGFGVYDPDLNVWKTPLIQSLIPEFVE